MLYRPNYCCHCGEKIDRAKWTPLTSRRFCDFCEIEQKQHDLLPRAVMVLAVLMAAAGLTSYIGRSGNSGETVQKRVSQRGDAPAGSIDREANRSGSNAEAVKTAQVAPNSSVPQIDTPANFEQRQIQRNSSTESVYHCGALTKKGTPCTRRVKSRTRCWQHTGQPAARDEH